MEGWDDNIVEWRNEPRAATQSEYSVDTAHCDTLSTFSSSYPVLFKISFDAVLIKCEYRVDTLQYSLSVLTQLYSVNRMLIQC